MPETIEGYRVNPKEDQRVYESTLRIRIKEEQIVNRIDLLTPALPFSELHVMLIQNTSRLYRIEEHETTKVNLFILKDKYLVLSPSSLVKGKFEANEVQKFEHGQQAVLVKPAYICLLSFPGEKIKAYGSTENVQTRIELDRVEYFKLEGWVVRTSLFTTVKTELCIILNRVSDRLFGITKEKRTEIKEKIKQIAGDPLWSPSRYGDPKLYAMAESLMVKVNELVQIQTDRGKIWRNKATVDAIERGTHAMAGEFITILSEITDY